MGRSRASAKAGGARFAQDVADYLAAQWSDVIERRVQGGSKDRGDISGVRVNGHRIAIECKEVRTEALPAWIREAQKEAENDGAAVGVVVHKRWGVGAAEKQYVTMELRDLVKLFTLITPKPSS